MIQPARKYPYAKRQRLEQALRRLLSQGVIADVEGPTEWVHNLVVTEKKNGSLRLCLDPRPLNKAIKREHNVIPTAGDVQAQLAARQEDIYCGGYERRVLYGALWRATNAKTIAAALILSTNIMRKNIVYNAFCIMLFI